MQKAMQQYKDYAFQKLTQKSIAAFSTENTADYLSAFSNDLASIEKGYLKHSFHPVQCCHFHWCADYDAVLQPDYDGHFLCLFYFTDPGPL